MSAPGHVVAAPGHRCPVVFPRSLSDLGAEFWPLELGYGLTEEGLWAPRATVKILRPKDFRPIRASFGPISARRSPRISIRSSFLTEIVLEIHSEWIRNPKFDRLLVKSALVWGGQIFNLDLNCPSRSHGLEKSPRFVRWMGFKESFIQTVYARPKLLVLLFVLLLLPLTVLLSFLAWDAMESEYASERRQILHFEELAAYRVVNSVGFELFNLHFFFSYKIRTLVEEPATDWPRVIAQQIATFQHSDRYPDLIDDALIAVDAPGGVPTWSRFVQGQWHEAQAPDWAPAAETLFHQAIDPQVSLERPTLLFPLPPEGISRRVFVIHYRVREVLEVITPALYQKAFAQGNGKHAYAVSVVRQDTPVTFPVPPTADWLVPLVPEMPFSEWLRTYLERQADYFPGPEPERRYIQNLTKVHPNQAEWALQVTLLPAGLATYSEQVHGRNRTLALALFASLWIVFGVFLFSIARVLRAGNRERAFVTLVSHELKTPLAALRSLSENLSGGYVSGPDRVKDYGSQILEQAGHLEGMVGNILALADLRNPKTTMELQVVDLGELARRAAAQTDWHVTGPIEERWMVLGNLAALEAAVGNLVSNAAKYGTASDGPPPEVNLAVRRARGGGRWIGLSVIDHGPGLSRSERRKCVSSFTKGLKASDAQIPGSGLGLSLIRITMRHLQGRLELSSTEGGGLTVTLLLKERKRL